MNLRPRLSYANVVATVALVLAIGGGTVYAAAQLGKNDVRSRNIAPGAVKRADLGKNAVTSPKIRNRTIREADFAPGVIRDDSPDISGSATGGPFGPVNGPESPLVPVPLTGTTTFTPRAGQVVALAAEAQWTLVNSGGMATCQPAAALFINGEQTRVFLGPIGTSSTTPVTQTAHDADGPFGVLNPGQPITFTAQLRGDPDCAAASQLDRLEVRIAQID